MTHIVVSRRALGALLTLSALALGCRGTSIERLVEQSYPPHQQQVCVVEGSLPETLAYTEIARVHVALNSYGGDRKAKRGLANAARRLGAQAVHRTSFGNTMGAPEGWGVAVVYDQAGQTPPAECEWY